jgi:transposase
MTGFYRAYEPDQGGLFPVSPRDWLPEGHLAFFIAETVDQLDLGELERSYRAEGKGALAYHPRLMLKLLVYAYSTGTFASRKIAQRVEESIPYRYLSAGAFPNHRTICRFREKHLAAFESLFVQIVQIAQESGLVKMGTLAIDGSKVKASASKHKAMSYGRMQQQERQLKREIHELTGKAAQRDAVDDEKFGPDFRGDELPEELTRRKTRLKVIQDAKRRLEERKAAEAQEAAQAQEKAEKPRLSPGKSKRGRPPKKPPGTPRPKDQENFTDPDSRIMKDSSGGFQQSYNAQIAVDEAEQIIVAADVSQSAADARQLLPMVEQAEQNTEQAPDRVLADAGYRSEENFQALEKKGIDAYIPLGREGRARKCNPAHLATARMKRKMDGKRARRRYKKRKHIVEPAFGWIKAALGFRSFSLRGVPKVRGEWSLICLATNLRRMNGKMAWA